MSIPPSRTIPGGAMFQETAYDWNPPSTAVSVYVYPAVYQNKTTCSSSAGVRRHTSFIYRGPTVMVDGNLRIEGETYSTDELSSVIDPIVHKKYPKRRAERSVSGNIKDENGRWIKPRKKGQRIVYPRDMWRNPLPYSVQLMEGNITHFSGFREYNSTDYPGRIRQLNGDLNCADHGMSAPAFPAYDAGLADRCIVKALMKVKDQDVNLAVAMGERVETADMLLGTLRSLTKAAKAARKGNLRAAAKALSGVGGGTREREIVRHARKKGGARGKAFLDNWLALQYGWKPLYQDVYGSVRALHKRDNDQPQRYSVSVRATMKQPSKFEERQYRNYGFGSMKYVSRLELVTVRLDYFVANPLLRSLSQLGITNPAEVAWELVPFSFVVDWFTPVGNYLSCMDADLGLQFRAGSITRVIRQECSAYLFPSYQTTPNRLAFHTPSAHGHAGTKGIKMDRTVYQNSPLPRAPGTKNPFPQGSSHIANAIALFASIVATKAK